MIIDPAIRNPRWLQSRVQREWDHRIRDHSVGAQREYGQ
jgi:hypothetical protein